MTHIGYKKLQNGLIAKLAIKGTHNEDRDDVVDIMHAKHRCSKAKVLDIYHMISGEKRDFGYSLFDKKFEYRIGKIVSVKDYNKNVDDVCSAGIHYFLSEDVAFCWNIDEDYAKQIMWTGVLKDWYENGRLKFEASFKNGVYEGEVKSWQSNGVLDTVRYYKNGIEDGEYRSFHQNGRLYQKYIYSNGLLNGSYEKWFSGGRICEKGAYNKGVKVGLWKKWDQRGYVWSSVNFDESRKRKR